MRELNAAKGVIAYLLYRVGICFHPQIQHYASALCLVNHHLNSKIEIGCDSQVSLFFSRKYPPKCFHVVYFEWVGD